ncbi:MAG TPA: hypothetical protein VG963_09725 [Polyangiaceae bacterium]|nr:hypothetical protein [Polyangiaceae bacterium]
MNRLLILLALAGVGTAMACGDDGDDDSSSTQDAGNHDAATVNDAGQVSRGTQIDNVGAECTSNSDCKGKGTIMCYNNFLGTDYPGGYCSAACMADDECGTNGACPVAQLNTLPLVGTFVAGLLPENCLLKCDKSQSSACRTGYNCQSLDDALGAAASLIGGFLPANLTSQPYCLPPVNITIPDGGFVFPLPDAGVSHDAGVTSGVNGGLDAGAGVDAGH